MNAADLVRTVRRRANLTLRALAELAETSHSALSAYESGAKVPNAATLDRIIRAAGFDLRLDEFVPSASLENLSRGEELEQVLALAEQFPVRHDEVLRFPKFPSAPKWA